MAEELTMKIAIDGPAGAGKSTISKSVAKQLGYVHIDTGAMYRSVGLACLNKGIDSLDSNEIEKILHEIDIKIENLGSVQKFFLNGQDVTKTIREPEVSVAASNVATIDAVRLKLVDIQRDLAKNTDVVMDGRDIGTYVLPDADLKIFLTASVDERARRRFTELCEKNTSVTIEEVKEDIIFRDTNDSERKFAPLKPADDSVILDSTDLSIEQVVDNIVSLVKEKENETI